MTSEGVPTRDPRYNPPRPEIRNMRAPEPTTYEGDKPQQEPWGSLEPILTPFHQERTQDVLAKLEDAFDEDDPDLDYLTRIAYEAIAEAVNTELRDTVTRMQHIIELSLSRASSHQTGLSRENTLHLLESLEHAGDLLNAQLPREELATHFLNLQNAPFDLAESLQAHAQRLSLDPAPKLWLEPAPVKGDRDRVTQALGTLLRFLAYRTQDGTLGIRVTWKGEHVYGFVGTTAPHLTEAHLIAELSQPVRLDTDDLDLPLARAVLELHGASLVATKLDDGWTGFQFRLPALEPEADR